MYQRHNKIGGTAANVIAHGAVYESNLYTLWQELTGEKPPLDLSNKLPVRMGQATEQFNREWFGEITGFQVEDPFQLGVIVSNERDYCVGQIDGFVVDDDFISGGKALFEAKHTHGYNYQLKIPKTIIHVAELYYPQIQHYLYVTNLKRAYLSVFFDNGTHDWQLLQRNDEFINQLLVKIDAFWYCVKNKIPPKMDGASMKIPEITKGKIETIDANHPSSNAWASAATSFLENKASASTFNASKKALKDLAPSDAWRTEGFGVSVVNSGTRRTVNAL
tara:strand:+ start:2885 stop:3715 length:831 start_codon:yes stop_codon:yes gene_type:complete